MPDGSVVKQLLLKRWYTGWIGRQTLLDAGWDFAALRPVFTSRLTGSGWYGVAQDRRSSVLF
eukprot:365052-Chlamydomonas_euryale.AAC.43